MAAATHTPEAAAAAAAAAAVQGGAVAAEVGGAARNMVPTAGGSGNSCALTAPAKVQHRGCGGPGSTHTT